MTDDLHPKTITTNSNQNDKDDLLPGNGNPWESAPGDTGPYVIKVTLDEDVTITEVTLIKPINVEEFTVTVTDSSNTQYGVSQNSLFELIAAKNIFC